MRLPSTSKVTLELDSVGNRATSFIIERRDAYACPWFKIVGKRVHSDGRRAEFEHYSVVQQDYVSVLAVTRAGLIPLVRQYRPAVESYTLEFPAGLLEPGEDPEHAVRRELTEETGLQAIEIVEVSSTYADTGRLSSCFHAFFAIAEESTVAVRKPELEVLFCSIHELRERILANKFVLQTHIGILYAAAIHPKVATMLSRVGVPDLLRR